MFKMNIHYEKNSNDFSLFNHIDNDDECAEQKDRKKD